MSSGTGEFPRTISLVSGKLTARVWVHEIDAHGEVVPCWSYISDGLREYGQKELIFTLRRFPREGPADFSEQPLRFFAQVHGFAEQGMQVDVGGITEFGSKGLLGFKGIAYAHPYAFHDVEISFPTLAAILLTEEELEAVKTFGITRVLARLGRAHQYYPFPPWFDRTRSSLPFRKTMEESVLAQMPRIKGPGLRVWVENDRIVFRLLPRGGHLMRYQLSKGPSGTPLAVLTELDPHANGCLVWEPGQSGPAAITPPKGTGSRLSGCFLAFVPGQPADGGSILEDGMAMLLTDTSWLTIIDALRTEKTVSIPATEEGMSFSIEWVKDTYHDPITGTGYYAASGWTTSVPGSRPSRGNNGIVEVKEIILLTSEAELKGRVPMEALVVYIEAIGRVLQEYFYALPRAPGQDLLLQFEVHPGSRVAIQMRAKPGMPDGVLRGIHDRLLSVPAPSVSRDQIRFQVLSLIWDGANTA